MNEIKYPQFQGLQNYPPLGLNPLTEALNIAIAEQLAGGKEARGMGATLGTQQRERDLQAILGMWQMENYARQRTAEKERLLETLAAAKERALVEETGKVARAKIYARGEAAKVEPPRGYYEILDKKIREATDLAAEEEALSVKLKAYFKKVTIGGAKVSEDKVAENTENRANLMRVREKMKILDQDILDISKTTGYVAKKYQYEEEKYLPGRGEYNPMVPEYWK